MAEKLLLEVNSDGVGVLTFNRPQARNALDLESMRRFAEIVDALAEVSGAPELRKRGGFVTRLY